MEPCTTHHEHCWCRIIPFIATLGGAVAITVYAIAKWKKISGIVCSKIKSVEE